MKNFMVTSFRVQMPSIGLKCSVPLRSWIRVFFHPDILTAWRRHNNNDDWRAVLLFRVKVKFRFFFFLNLISFWSHFTLVCIILWQKNETKGKGSLHTFYFKLQFIWASNMSVLFNSSGWYLSGFLKYNTH